MVAKKCKHCGEWLAEHDAAGVETHTTSVSEATPIVKKKIHTKPYVPKWVLITITALAALFSVLELRSSELSTVALISFLFDAILAVIGIVIVVKSAERWRNWGIAYFVLMLASGLIGLFVNDVDESAGFLFILALVIGLVCIIGLIVALKKNGRKDIGTQWIWTLGSVILAFLIVIGTSILFYVSGVDASDRFIDTFVVNVFRCPMLLLYITTFNMLNKVNSGEENTFIDWQYMKMWYICVFLMIAPAFRGALKERTRTHYTHSNNYIAQSNDQEENYDNDEEIYDFGAETFFQEYVGRLFDDNQSKNIVFELDVSLSGGGYRDYSAYYTYATYPDAECIRFSLIDEDAWESCGDGTIAIHLISETNAERFDLLLYGEFPIPDRITGKKTSIDTTGKVYEILSVELRKK